MTTSILYSPSTSRYPRSLTAHWGSLLSLALLLLAATASSTTEAFSIATASSPASTLRPRKEKQPHQQRIALFQASVVLPDAEYNTSDDHTLVSWRTPLQQRFQQVWMARGGSRTAAATKQKEGSFLKRHPFVSAVAITTVNAVLADVLSQLVFGGGSGAAASTAATALWDKKRTLVFGLFGFFYQGMVQYAIVNGVWEKAFPGTSRKAVISKICAMNLLSDPLLFMPCFYIFQQAMLASGGGGLSWNTIQTALMAYKANCLLDWRNSWMVWFPGHAVTYGVMPKHKRIPWMAFLSFFYMCILSITRG